MAHPKARLGNPARVSGRGTRNSPLTGEPVTRVWAVVGARTLLMKARPTTAAMLVSSVPTTRTQVGRISSTHQVLGVLQDPTHLRTVPKNTPTRATFFCAFSTGVGSERVAAARPPAPTEQATSSPDPNALRLHGPRRVARFTDCDHDGECALAITLLDLVSRLGRSADRMTGAWRPRSSAPVGLCNQEHRL